MSVLSDIEDESGEDFTKDKSHPVQVRETGRTYTTKHIRETDGFYERREGVVVTLSTHKEEGNTRN